MTYPYQTRSDSGRIVHEGHAEDCEQVAIDQSLLWFNDYEVWRWDNRAQQYRHHSTFNNGTKQ